jgi:hypothetical protein
VRLQFVSDEYSEDSVDEALLLKTAVAMIERWAIPKIGSFVDIVLSYDNQEFHMLTIDSALRLETKPFSRVIMSLFTNNMCMHIFRSNRVSKLCD